MRGAGEPLGAPLPYASPMTPAPAPIKRKGSGRVARSMTHIGLVLVCIGFLMPVVFMISTSFKARDRVMTATPEFIPDPFRPQNYKEVLTDPKFNFLLYARNTVLIAVLTVVGTTLSSALVAYGFARIKFRGRGVLFAVMLSTMMIPFPVTMVGLFVVFRFLGDTTGVQFLGTFKPLWLPAWFASAFNVFLLRQFFMTIPTELSEAARIDGCSEFGIFWRVMLPLARPALAVVALFSFMWAWNDFLGPLIYLQRPEQYTLSLGLVAFQSQHGGTPFNLVMAASVMVVAPVLVLFFLTQRTFIQGIATTGMKG
jgi:multiple sugar transport system permease protein